MDPRNIKLLAIKINELEPGLQKEIFQLVKNTEYEETIKSSNTFDSFYKFYENEKLKDKKDQKKLKKAEKIISQMAILHEKEGRNTTEVRKEKPSPRALTRREPTVDTLTVKEEPKAIEKRPKTEPAKTGTAMELYNALISEDLVDHTNLREPGIPVEVQDKKVAEFCKKYKNEIRRIGLLEGFQTSFKEEKVEAQIILTMGSLIIGLITYLATIKILELTIHILVGFPTPAIITGIAGMLASIGFAGYISAKGEIAAKIENGKQLASGLLASNNINSVGARAMLNIFIAELSPKESQKQLPANSESEG